MLKTQKVGWVSNFLGAVHKQGAISYAFKLFKKLFLVLDEPSKRPL
jgi:hypothetical protein